MDEMIEGSVRRSSESIFKRLARAIWVGFFVVADAVMDIIERDWHIIKREGDLFGGAFILLLGALNVQSGKYCDGNAADYLSCTRPTTYYYYNGLEVALIIIGVFLILLWFQKRAHR